MDPARSRVHVVCAAERLLWHWQSTQSGQLEQHPPDQATVTLGLTKDLFLRSYTWARWQLGIALPMESVTNH